MTIPQTADAQNQYLLDQANELYPQLAAFYDPCKMVPFPSYATLYQTAVLRALLEAKVIPLSVAGVMQFFGSNKGGSSTRPAVEQAIWTNTYYSPAVQAEQRAYGPTGSGDANIANWLFGYFGWIWAAERVQGGQKDCWLQAQGLSREQGTAKIRAYALEYMNRLPPGTIDGDMTVADGRTPLGPDSSIQPVAAAGTGEDKTVQYVPPITGGSREDARAPGGVVYTAGPTLDGDSSGIATPVKINTLTGGVGGVGSDSISPVDAATTAQPIIRAENDAAPPAVQPAAASSSIIPGVPTWAVVAGALVLLWAANRSGR